MKAEDRIAQLEDRLDNLLKEINEWNETQMAINRDVLAMLKQLADSVSDKS